ncbi:c-type cytochrome [Paracoccus benzoatiresistens]|uniref:Cytochrome c n=1 Tax=Paracoccus benzoatiresistens TaxID=2997341 RepID=A0ABT4J5D2_9RHOB|nr:cytochrome c [Paracoccus sp. EF6]MCZ0962340.1 cytochrome c [Paracoccus sp. EF6]
MKFMLYPLAMIGLTALPALAQDARPDTAGWFEDPSKLTQTDGKAIYDALCAACHMPEGQGAVGAGLYPALAGNENLLAADYPVHVVTHGQKAMPPLGDLLDDAQVAAVVNYIRTSFGNGYAEDPATAESVAAAR